MAQPINVGGQGQDIMQLLLLLEKLDEGKAEREQARLDAQTERAFAMQRFELERQDKADAQRRQDADALFSRLKEAKNKDGDPRFTDSEIENIMAERFPDLFSRLPEGAPAKPKVGAGKNIAGTRKRGFGEAADQGGLLGLGEELIETGGALLGGQDVGAGLEAQFLGEGTMPLVGEEGLIPASVSGGVPSAGALQGGGGRILPRALIRRGQ